MLKNILKRFMSCVLICSVFMQNVWAIEAIEAVEAERRTSGARGNFNERAFNSEGVFNKPADFELLREPAEKGALKKRIPEKSVLASIAGKVAKACLTGVCVTKDIALKPVKAFGSHLKDLSYRASRRGGNEERAAHLIVSYCVLLVCVLMCVPIVIGQDYDLNLPLGTTFYNYVFPKNHPYHKADQCLNTNRLDEVNITKPRGAKVYSRRLEELQNHHRAMYALSADSSGGGSNSTADNSVPLTDALHHTLQEDGRWISLFSSLSRALRGNACPTDDDMKKFNTLSQQLWSAHTFRHTDSEKPSVRCDGVWVNGGAGDEANDELVLTACEADDLPNTNIGCDLEGQTPTPQDVAIWFNVTNGGYQINPIMVVSPGLKQTHTPMLLPPEEETATRTQKFFTGSATQTPTQSMPETMPRGISPTVTDGRTASDTIKLPPTTTPRQTATPTRTRPKTKTQEVAEPEAKKTWLFWNNETDIMRAQVLDDGGLGDVEHFLKLRVQVFQVVMDYNLLLWGDPVASYRISAAFFKKANSSVELLEKKVLLDYGYRVHFGLIADVKRQRIYFRNDHNPSLPQWLFASFNYTNPSEIINVQPLSVLVNFAVSPYIAGVFIHGDDIYWTFREGSTSLFYKKNLNATSSSNLDKIGSSTIGPIVVYMVSSLNGYIYVTTTVKGFIYRTNLTGLASHPVPFQRIDIDDIYLPVSSYLSLVHEGL